MGETPPSGVPNDSSVDAKTCDTVFSGLDEKLGKAEEDARIYWINYAQQYVRQYVAIVVWHSDDLLSNLIKASRIAMMKADDSGLVLYHFDPKIWGESVSNPMYRSCPLQVDKYKNLCNIFLTARGDAHLGRGELALLLNGGKCGNNKKLMQPWLPSSGECGEGSDHASDQDDEQGTDASRTGILSGGFANSLVHVIKTGKSVGARKTRQPTKTASLDQFEQMVLVGHGSLSLPERAWGVKGLEGTNRETFIGPLALQPLSEDWKETVKMKRDIYGKDRRVHVGGTGGAGPSKPEADDHVQSVFLHPMCRDWYRALVKGYFGKAVLDFTVGPGLFAQVCLEQRVQYFGVACTELHAEKIYKRLEKFVLHSMLSDSSPLHNAKCVEALGSDGKRKNTQPEKDGKANKKPKKDPEKDPEKDKANKKAKKDPEKDKEKDKEKKPAKKDKETHESEEEEPAQKPTAKSKNRKKPKKPTAKSKHGKKKSKKDPDSDAASSATGSDSVSSLSDLDLSDSGGSD